MYSLIIISVKCLDNGVKFHSTLLRYFFFKKTKQEAQLLNLSCVGERRVEEIHHYHCAHYQQMLGFDLLF